jgi:prophage DNA circulation protein
MRIDMLQAASFRGARFLVPHDKATAGRKTIEHNYPDSSRRYLEDNGREVPNFTLTMILHGPSIQRDWAALHNALTQPGPGTLKHPWWGTRRVSVMGRYTVKRDDKNAGWIEVECEFGEGTSAAFPARMTAIPAMVGVRARELVDLATQELASRWETPMAASAHENIADHLEGYTQAIARGARAETDAALEILWRPERFLTDGGKLARNLAALTVEPFDSDDIAIEQCVSCFKAAADYIETLDAAATVIDPRTRRSEQHKALLEMLTETLSALTLAGFAWATAVREHKTADLVKDDERLLRTLHDDARDRATSTDVDAAIVATYVAASDVLSERIFRLPRINQMEISGMPASVLAYMLYDDANRDLAFDVNDQIPGTWECYCGTTLDLNPKQSPIWMEGTVNVFAYR